MRNMLLLLIIVTVVGCQKSPTPPQAAASQPTTIPAQSWTGVAMRNKSFAFILTDTQRIYVDLPNHGNCWPDGVEGKWIRVVGTLVERHDLPVFIPKPGGPILQGIPVPPGTDLYKASARNVVENAKWSVVGDGG